MFYCTLQIRNYNIGKILMSALFTEGKRTKEYDLRGEAVLKTWILQPCTLKAHCVCLESLSVMSRMRNVAVWFFTHAAGSSISGNISHSASLTPSALLQYPHIFPSFHFFPYPPSLPPCSPSHCSLTTLAPFTLPLCCTTLANLPPSLLSPPSAPLPILPPHTHTHTPALHPLFSLIF